MVERVGENPCAKILAGSGVDERQGGRSYWNFPPPSRYALFISGMICLSITSVCLYKFIIPSIGILKKIINFFMSRHEVHSMNTHTLQNAG